MFLFASGFSVYSSSVFLHYNSSCSRQNFILNLPVHRYRLAKAACSSTSILTSGGSHRGVPKMSSVSVFIYNYYNYYFLNHAKFAR